MCCCVPRGPVTCVVHDDCIRMSRGIVQKLSYLFHHVLCWICLLCGSRLQCREHGAVITSRIIEESAYDLLNEFLVFFGEQRQGVCVFCVLRLCSIVGLDVWVWLILRFTGCSVLETREGLRDVVEH